MTMTNGRLRRAPDRQGTPAAIARYATLGDARDAIQTLEGSGVDGVDIVLAGWRARAAERSQQKGGADGQFVRHMTRSVFRGSVLGGVVGLVLGAIVAGVVVLAWPGELHSAWLAFVIGAGFGMGLGALVGAFIDVEKHVGFSDAWALTLQDIPDGSLWLLLFDDGERARDALLRTNPVEVRAPTPA